MGNKNCKSDANNTNRSLVLKFKFQEFEFFRKFVTGNIRNFYCTPVDNDQNSKIDGEIEVIRGDQKAKFSLNGILMLFLPSKNDDFELMRYFVTRSGIHYRIGFESKNGKFYSIDKINGVVRMKEADEFEDILKGRDGSEYSLIRSGDLSLSFRLILKHVFILMNFLPTTFISNNCICFALKLENTVSSLNVGIKKSVVNNSTNDNELIDEDINLCIPENYINEFCAIHEEDFELIFNENK